MIPSVIRPSPLVTWRTPKSCRSSGGVEFVVNAPVAREVWNLEFSDTRRVLQEISKQETLEVIIFANLYALYLVERNRNMAVKIERCDHYSSRGEITSSPGPGRPGSSLNCWMIYVSGFYRSEGGSAYFRGREERKFNDDTGLMCLLHPS